MPPSSRTSTQGDGFIDVTTAEGDEGGGEFAHLPLGRAPLRVARGAGAPIDEEAVGIRSRRGR